MTSFYHERHKSESLEAILEEGGYTTWAMDACHDILDARRECQRLRKIIERKQDALKHYANKEFLVKAVSSGFIKVKDPDQIAIKALLPEE